MTLAVLAPYRADTPHREAIQVTTRRLWAEQGVEVVYADDGLDGLFSYARAANRARKMTDADHLLIYNVDALPLPSAALAALEQVLSDAPWSVVFEGQRRFTPAQTEWLLRGATPEQVGEPGGEICWGREALPAVRASVWDELRGMDERFIGWGAEDLAFHHVLRELFPTGNDQPRFGLFRSLWHPDTPRSASPTNYGMWDRYRGLTGAALRAFYLGRP